MRSFSFLIIALLFTPPLAGAESILYNTTLPVALTTPPYSDESLHAALGDNLGGVTYPNVSVEYHTAVTRRDTGETVTCGSSVPTGTPLSFSFVPHKKTDISWFGTGAGYDSPYGDWSSSAAPPSIACSSDDFVGRYFSQYIYAGSADIFSALRVAPPTKRIDSLTGLLCETPLSDGSVRCSAVQTGSFSPRFIFDPTYGYFYGRLWAGVVSPEIMPQCWGSNTPMYDYWKSGYPTVKLQVPQQILSCPITVTPASTQTVPPPTISTALGQCITGSVFAIRLSGSSPNAKNIRYGVDWANTGVVTQYVPASGFVSSGTQQTASRTFASTGPKTIRVRTEEENGSVSNWATMTFACSNPTTPQYVGGAGDSGNTFGSRSPAISIRAVPSLVRGGSTTRVIWTAENVTSCSVSGTNGDKWTNENTSPTAGEISGPIKAQTVYTLTCTSPTGDISADTTVNIIPVFEER